MDAQLKSLISVKLQAPPQGMPLLVQLSEEAVHSHPGATRPASNGYVNELPLPRDAAERQLEAFDVLGVTSIVYVPGDGWQLPTAVLPPPSLASPL